MYSLILDSSYKCLLVALAKDNKLIDVIQYDAWQRQSEEMIPEIDNILKKNAVNPKDISEIIVTHGPGSYTGVRIALTIAKVYCYSLKIPCYALSSLMVLQKESNESICLLNARSNRSYIGVYKDGKCLLKDQVMTNDDVMKYIEEHKKYTICGDCEYLNIEGYTSNMAENMLRLKSKNNEVENILALKAVYLKD